MKRIIKFFTSVRLAIALMILLTVASVLGTLIPQGRTLEEYTLRYGSLSGLFLRLQLTQLFRSIWFLALLALFALNIAVCTLVRLFPKIRRAFRPHVVSDPVGLSAFKMNDRFKVGATPAGAGVELKRILSGARYTTQKAVHDSKVHMLARKRTSGIFGPDVVHIGLLVILAGGIVSGLGGIRGRLAFKEGDIHPVPGAAFGLRLDKFVTEYYPDGNVRDWKSTLTVLKKGKPVRTRTVEVNHPLTYKGYSFYQMSYGWDWDSAIVEIWAKKKSDSSFLKKAKLKIGERVDIEDQDRTAITVGRFIPDFVLGENNEAETRSLRPDNPAVLIEGFRSGEKVFSRWVFAGYPDFSRMHGTPENDLTFELKSFEAGQISVIEAAKDPGANLIWIGCALLMAGLGLAFYWPTWEIRAILEESQGKTVVIVGGLAAKSREAFAAEFARITAAMRRSK